MKKFKKILSVFLATLILVMAVPFSALTVSALTPASNDNVFLDAIEYLGYDVQGLKDNGHLFSADAWSNKTLRRQYLSDVPYGTGCTGLETTSKGLPDVAAFERGGLVCASYVAYVYFNYLPNVVGFDTTKYIDIPNNPKGTGDWIRVLDAAVAKGTITKDTSSSKMNNAQIGDILMWDNVHMAIYAGYADGHHWITHCGNSAEGPVIHWATYIEDDKGNAGNVTVVYKTSDIQNTGQIRINKVDERGMPLSGAVFRVYNSDGRLIETLTTNNNGYAVTNDDQKLTYGTYTVVEVTAPTNYDKGSKTSWTVVLDSELETLNVVNYRQHGDVVITKTAEDNIVEGVKFNLKGTSTYGTTINLEAITDENGIAKFENIEIGSYMVEELGASNRYLINVPQGVTVTANGEANISFINRLKLWKAVVTKTDSSGTVIGDCTLEGAVYGLYDGNHNLLDTYTTGADGSFVTDSYETGTGYYLKEITAPTGYQLNDAIYSLDAYTNPGVLTERLNTFDFTVSDNPIQGTIELEKVTDMPNNVGVFDTPEKDAEFVIYSQKYNSYEEAVASGDLRNYDNCIIDENGVAIWSNNKDYSKELNYGKYIVHQTKGWEGRAMTEDFVVTVSEHSKRYGFNLTNPIYNTELTIEKYDFETNKLIINSPTSFKILNTDTNEYFSYNNGQSDVDVFKTENGRVVIPVKIPFGKYKVVEVQAPAGYTNSGEEISFVVDKNSPAVTTLKFYNKPLKGKISISKTGLQFIGVDTSATEFGTLYSPVFNNELLAGVEIEVIAKEDIITADGTVRYAKGTVIETLITNKDNAVISDELYLGEYEIKEKATVAGYKLIEEPISVTVINDGSELVKVIDVNIENERAKTEINIEKLITEWSTVAVDDEILRELITLPGENVVFGLFADTDLFALDGVTFIAKDSLVALFSTDNTGKIKASGDLPFGQYYIKELKAASDKYVVSDKAYYLELTTPETTGTTIVCNVTEEPILNDFIRTFVTILKTNKEGEPLADALIGIYNSSDELIYQMYTDENGEIKFEVEPGEYTFKEIKAPSGYVLNETAQGFEVDNLLNVTGTLTMVNERIVYPQTGDDGWMPLEIALAAAVLSAVGLSVSTIYLVRENKKKKSK